MLADDPVDAVPVAVDVVIEHMTPYPTLLDQVWKRVIYPLVKKIEISME